MLDKITVQNFKGIKFAKVEIKTITALIGKNGSGKSSISQLLLLLIQSNNFPNLNLNGEIISLGSFFDICYEQNPLNLPSVKLEGKVGSDIRYSFIIEINQNLIKRSGYIFFNNIKLEVNNLDVTINYNGLDVTLISGRSLFVPFQLISRPSSMDNDEFNRINDDLKCIYNDIHTFKLINENRGVNELNYELGKSPSSNLTLSNNYHTKNLNWLTTVAYQPDILNQVSKWCEEILDSKVNYQLIPNKRVQLQRDHIKKGYSINLLNEGYGLNQLAFVLTQFAMMPKRSILSIDEPEIHLHPGAQIRFMKVLIREALKHEIKIIISTHSEHIIYELLTAVSEKNKFMKDNLSVNQFTTTEEGVKVENLEFDEFGQIKGGLRDFFEVSINQYKRFIDMLASGKK